MCKFSSTLSVCAAKSLALELLFRFITCSSCCVRVSAKSQFQGASFASGH